MRTIQHLRLRKIAAGILEGAGATAQEAAIVSDALVDANLDGHDSHGMVRLPEYVRWMERGVIVIGAQIQVLDETGVFAVIDGNWGWGQVVGRQAMEVAIEKASKAGVGMVSVRQCSHLGRAGDYPLMAARRGMAAIMFLNTHGAGRIVAPWGGRERRLSANPIALSVPRSSGEPILVDISTCAIAGGKVRVALHSKKSVPPNCIIDAEGRPTTNPADFFGPPEGALLPFGGHKGFALALLSDILAGALSGAGCSRPDATRVGNSFLAIVIDIPRFRDRKAFDADVDQLVEYVKSSKLAPGFTEILIPGEPERRERAHRERDGIPIDEETWRQIHETASRYGIRGESVCSQV
ncbi:MAG: Ldh family oxidoreductase [Acidobacteriia bacterium]|nr:Ldh family oxidoreductase [Terriglobia bacterium]